ncbi:acyl-CoA carboxylase subunit epsilon [Nocardioides conyzicola]|uniref:Acyl-CoA carboxylase subunit epsilon n=1 Tax=Nocardioides conyzicola TaxID=1651781 RepID=A0ABP8WR01_9ACTN
MPQTTAGEEAATTAETSPTPPALRIINADATPEEVAAIVAVFSALQSAPAPEPRRTPEWSAPHRTMRRTLPHGPGGWRSSSLPR